MKMALVAGMALSNHQSINQSANPHCKAVTGGPSNNIVMPHSHGRSEYLNLPDRPNSATKLDLLKCYTDILTC